MESDPELSVLVDGGQITPLLKQIRQFARSNSEMASFQLGSIVNSYSATTGFIPIEVLGDPFILGGVGGEQTICGGVFAQLGGGTNLTQNGGTLTNPGVPIFTDGTLSTLIVTGISVAGNQIRCSDLTDTAPVHDSDLVQPYFVIDTNSVVLAVGPSQLPLTCLLNIAAGDQAGSISVQWAKYSPPGFRPGASVKGRC